MGKQGPCYHCGVSITPLWRNGPPEKPVLCNACGSRWRTKGTLANYTPLHARAEADEYEDHRASTVMTVSLKRSDEKLKKRKLSFVDTFPRSYASENNQNFLKIMDQDTSNRSSSGSAVSNSESCSQFNGTDVSDLTGPAQSVVWDTQVPSRKRTCMTRPKSSPVEKLIKDLHAILQKQRSSYLPMSSEEDLLFESDGPLVSVEIGHGSVLIKHPSSLLQEEESEASSFSFENQYSSISACSNSAPFSRCDNFKGDSHCYHGNENCRRPRGERMHQDSTMRGWSSCDWTQLLWTQDSPLIHIDLSDVINFEVLVEHFTSDEQQQLLRYLSPPDASQLPGSLQGMFDSFGFAEDLSCLQQLLSEGVFNSNYTGVEAEDLKVLNELVVSNATKSIIAGSNIMLGMFYLHLKVNQAYQAPRDHFKNKISISQKMKQLKARYWVMAKGTCWSSARFLMTRFCWWMCQPTAPFHRLNFSSQLQLLAAPYTRLSSAIDTTSC